MAIIKGRQIIIVKITKIILKYKGKRNFIFLKRKYIKRARGGKIKIEGKSKK